MPVLERLRELSNVSLNGYRKHVLYDFSVVEKAKIQIIETVGSTIGSLIPGSPECNLKLVEELPVQINPNTISYEHYIDPDSIYNDLEMGAVAQGFVKHRFGGNERGTFEPQLQFDIYDEYNARTMNGALPTDFSLMNEHSTSLPMLIKYASENCYYARFMWGDIVKFGLLVGVTVTYTAFSQWGQPLKADATVHIVEQRTLDGAQNLVIDGLGLSSIKTAAKRVATGIKNSFRSI